MTVTAPKEWQAPSPDASEEYRLGWLKEATEQGSAFNESQRGFTDWREAFAILSGCSSGKAKDAVDYHSQLSGRRLKTNIRTAISGLANIRPLWGFHAAKDYAPYAAALNKTCWALYLENYWDQDIKECLWWAAATGGGFMRPVYRRNIQGEGNIYLDSFGTPSVLPVQLPRNGDYNGAYIVTLLEELPIFEAHWRWPLFQDRIKPTTSRYWHAPQIRGASKQNAMRRVLDWFRRNGEDKLSDQYAPIRWTTINDCSINLTSRRIHMGQPGASWEYEVPYLGEEIPDGAGGTRFADENDCKIYPQRRVMCSSDNCIMYDGPGFNWDGDLDLTQFTMDRLPWEPIGFSMIHDGAELQKSIDEIDRSAMNKIRAQMDPSLAYPIGGVTKQEAEDFDPFAPRQRIGYDEQAVDQPFKLCVPQEVYQIGGEAFKLREVLIEELDYQVGTRDLVEMGKARALAKDMDSMEKLLKSYGPIVQDIARAMERSIGRVGRQVGWRIIQYMPTARLMQYADIETLAMGCWDFDPASIVPSHSRGENPFEEDGVTPRASMWTKMQRAKQFAKNIRMIIMPHSLHEYAQVSYKLGLTQLRGRGFPIAAATVMEAFEIPDVAKPAGNTEQERFYSEKEDEIVHAARLQKIVQEMGVEQGLAIPPGAGGPKPTGRPPSNKQPAHQAQKDGGRPIISTS
jgi:hypothetical protein